MYYYEVTVEDAGEDGNVTLGLATERFNLSRQVGTEPR